jgi:hypothetical protein
VLSIEGASCTCTAHIEVFAFVQLQDLGKPVMLFLTPPSSSSLSNLVYKIERLGSLQTRWEGGHFNLYTCILAWLFLLQWVLGVATPLAMWMGSGYNVVTKVMCLSTHFCNSSRNCSTSLYCVYAHMPQARTIKACRLPGATTSHSSWTVGHCNLLCSMLY